MRNDFNLECAGAAALSFGPDPREERPAAMNEEEKNAAVADLMRYRALRIGCPIYGDFYGLLHRLQAEKNLAEVVNTPARQCGYYDHKTGRFSLSPV